MSGTTTVSGQLMGFGLFERQREQSEKPFSLLTVILKRYSIGGIVNHLFQEGPLIGELRDVIVRRLLDERHRFILSPTVTERDKLRGERVKQVKMPGLK